MMPKPITNASYAERIASAYENPPEDWDKFYEACEDLSDQCLNDGDCVRYEFPDESAIVIWPNLPAWDIGHPGTHRECYCFSTVEEHHRECEEPDLPTGASL